MKGTYSIQYTCGCKREVSEGQTPSETCEKHGKQLNDEERVPAGVRRLYDAVTDYVEENGGKVVAIGGIQVQEWPRDNKSVYRIAIKCTGKKPEFTKND